MPNLPDGRQECLKFSFLQYDSQTVSVDVGTFNDNPIGIYTGSYREKPFESRLFPVSQALVW